MTQRNEPSQASMKTFVYVGCGRKTRAQTGPGFKGEDWREIRLDIDPRVAPDIVGNMTDMSGVRAGPVDAMFSSHNIEHLYPREVPQALAKFNRVLNPDGIAVLTCPDPQSVCALVAADKLTEPAYTSPAGPISPLDILPGHRDSIQRGNLCMAHRRGFTLRVRLGTLKTAGFAGVFGLRRAVHFDLWAIASTQAIDTAAQKLMAERHFSKRHA